MLTRPPRKRPPPPAAGFNCFAEAAVAERYRRARPFYHPEVVRWLCEAAGRKRFSSALDVGCGAGHSTIALSPVADSIIGLDPSPEMLQQAEPAKRVTYRQGSAESLDFSPGQFDLVTVGSALHWFDQPRFYAACRRVMRPNALLLVYNDHFTTYAPELPEVKRWMRMCFSRRFPVPRRGMRDMDEPTAEVCGFRILRRGSFEHRVPFLRQQFIAYLLTRSNTLTAVASGRESAESAALWMDGELSAFLPESEPVEFLFKCNLWLLAPEPDGGPGDALDRADAVE